MKRFCGWEPAQFTEQHPATGDTPARSVTRRETEWDDGQRLWMLALAHYETTLCRKCGHSLNTTTDPDTDPDNPQATRKWVAELPTECYCCKVLARSERKIAADENNRIPTEALIHTAVQVITPPRRKQPGRGAL